MSFRDPRARMVIHYYWKGQMVPILANGLPSKRKAQAGAQETGDVDWQMLKQPPLESVRAISPYAQILAGKYRTPTFLVNGDNDNQCPCGQSRDTVAALQAAGVEAGFAAPRGAGHGFDFWPGEDPLGTAWLATLEAYDFARQCVGF